MTRTDDEAERLAYKIMDTFRPLVCKTKIVDYNNRIKFKVLHECKKVFEGELVIDDLTAVNRVRRDVLKKIKEEKPKLKFEFIAPDLEA